MISRLAHLLRRLGSLADDLDARHEEAYLSASTDVYDLERRMRELDGRRQRGYINAYLSMPAGTGR